MDLTNLDQTILKELADYVTNRFDEYKKSSKREEVLKRIEESRKAYDQDVKPTSFPWKDASNILIPLTTISTDQLEPRLAASIIGRAEIIVTEDFGKLDEETSESIANLDNAVLENDVNIRPIVKRHVHKILLDGQVYPLIYWSFRESWNKEYATDPTNMQQMQEGAYNQSVQAGTSSDMMSQYGLPTNTQMTPRNGMMTYDFKQVVQNGCRIEDVDITDLYLPDRIDDWEDAPKIRKCWMEWGEYKAKIKDGKMGWIPKTGEELIDLEGRLYDKRPDPDDRLSIPDPNVRSEGDTEAAKIKRELLLLEGHFTYDVNEDGIEERLIVRIEHGSKKVLYVCDNSELDPLNRCQIQLVRLLEESGTGYGYPVHRKLKMIENGASQLFNMLVNSAMIQMLPWYFFEESAGFKTQEIDLYPGAGIPVGNVDKIKIPQIQPTAAAFKDFLQIFLGLWERVISISDYNMGRESSSTERTTATSTLALLQEAAVVHEYLGGGLQEQYTKIFSIIHDLYYMNLTPESEMEIIGKNLPRVLSRNYKFKLAASTKSSNRHVERMEIQEALAVAKEGVTMGVINPIEPIRSYLKTFRKSDVDVDKWLTGPIVQISARIQQDPVFAQAVMTMLQTPPEEIMVAAKNKDIGEKVTGEVEEAIGGLQKGLEQ